MKILVIQQKMIGDVLVSTMLCERLKKYVPESEIHYLINSNTEAVVKNNPHIDRIVFFKDEYRNSKWFFYKFLKGVTRENYDVVIDVYGKIESILISLFSRAKLKISYQKWYSKSFYTHTFKYLTTGNTNLGLAIENRLRLLTPLIDKIDEKINPPKIYLTDDEILYARSFLENNGVDFSKPIIMMNILGSSENKTYPLSYMSEIVDSVAEKGEFTVLFNYMPSQLKKAKELYGLCSSKSNTGIKFEIFTPSLRSFLGVLYHCKALIGNEGGAINMAKALNVPTFSIFSPWIRKAGWETFKNSDSNISVHLNDYEPLLIEGKSRKQLKKDTHKLYAKFKPSLFNEKIAHFLGTKILANK